jgi:tripartite-type tricarboxylate transporter receptor subunit TctC
MCCVARRSNGLTSVSTAIIAAMGFVLSGFCAQAQTTPQTPPPAWPERQVRLIVPFPPGGATDLVARVLAQRVSADIGQPIIVDNKPGAGGTIGVTEAAKANADGHTLVLTTSSTHAISPHLMAKLPYDAIKDFSPILHVADAASVLLVTPSLPVNTVAELVTYAKSNPDKLNFASSGNGTIVHLTAEAFKAQAGIAMTHVPYKGTALAIPDVINGNVHVIFDSIPSGMPHAKAGRLRALAVTGDARSALAAELPTVGEAGLPGFSSVTWFGLFAPANVKSEVVTAIHAAFEKALRSDDVKAALAKNGVDPAPTRSTAEFQALVAADSARWGSIIRDRKIVLE